MTSWLIDTSAAGRLARSPDSAVWAERTELELVRMSIVTRLESPDSRSSVLA